MEECLSVEIPEELIKELKQMSTFIVPLDIPEQELRKTVFTMSMKIRPGF